MTMMPLIIPVRMGSGDSIRRWELIDDWDYQLDSIHIHIPAGFIFDGASIPRVFTAIYATTGYLFIGALINDFLYQKGYYLEKFPTFSDATYKVYVGRSRADLMFKRVGNIEYPNHKGKTWLAYKALKIGGWVAWNKHRSKEAS